MLEFTFSIILSCNFPIFFSLLVLEFSPPHQFIKKYLPNQEANELNATFDSFRSGCQIIMFTECVTQDH